MTSGPFPVRTTLSARGSASALLAALAPLGAAPIVAPAYRLTVPTARALARLAGSRPNLRARRRGGTAGTPRPLATASRSGVGHVERSTSAVLCAPLCRLQGRH